MFTISVATHSDIPELLLLVNSAYRGEASRKGWTTEADLLAGELRTDAENLRELMEKENAVILQCREEGSGLVGCVYLEKRGDRMYLGMLTVTPERQTAGIGKLLMQAAEEHAASEQCRAVYFRVLSGRHELVAWYERRGYRLTGERQAYDAPAKFGTPSRFLEFELMEKIIV